MLRHTDECRERGYPFVADPSQQLAFGDGDLIRQLIDGAAFLFTNEYEAAPDQQKTGWSDDEILDRVGIWVVTLGAAGVRIEPQGRGTIEVGAVAEVEQGRADRRRRRVPGRLPGRAVVGARARARRPGRLPAGGVRRREGRHPGVHASPGRTFLDALREGLRRRRGRRHRAAPADAAPLAERSGAPGRPGRRRPRRPRRRTPGRASGTRPGCPTRGRGVVGGHARPARRPATSSRCRASSMTGIGQRMPAAVELDGRRPLTPHLRAQPRDDAGQHREERRRPAASVVSRVSETRTLPWVSTPIAASTWLGLERRGRAGRAAGDPEAPPVELGHQRLAVDVEAGERDQVGEPVDRGRRPPRRRGSPRHARRGSGRPARAGAAFASSRSATTACSAAAAARAAGDVLEAGGALVDPVVAGERVAPAGALARPAARRRPPGRPTCAPTPAGAAQPAGQRQPAHRGAGVDEQRDVGRGSGRPRRPAGRVPTSWLAVCSADARRRPGAPAAAATSPASTRPARSTGTGSTAAAVPGRGVEHRGVLDRRCGRRRRPAPRPASRPSRPRCTAWVPAAVKVTSSGRTPRHSATTARALSSSSRACGPGRAAAGGRRTPCRARPATPRARPGAAAPTEARVEVRPGAPAAAPSDPELRSSQAEPSRGRAPCAPTCPSVVIRIVSRVVSAVQTREARSWVRISASARPRVRRCAMLPRLGRASSLRRRARPRPERVDERSAMPRLRRTEQADAHLRLWRWAWVAAMVTGVIVWGLIFWSVVRYRRRSDDEIPVQTRYNLPLEIFYTVAPDHHGGRASSTTPSGAQNIDAVDQDTDPDPRSRSSASSGPGRSTTSTTTRSTAQVVYTSGTGGRHPDAGAAGRPDDPVQPVLARRHPLLLGPAFLIKMDVVPGPGQPLRGDARPIEGTYKGKCAELCGVYHSRMLFNVEVVGRGRVRRPPAGPRRPQGNGPTAAARRRPGHTTQAGLDSRRGRRHGVTATAVGRATASTVDRRASRSASRSCGSSPPPTTS